MRKFEFSEGTSNKFWQIDLSGNKHTVTYGKIGTEGQTKTKDFPDADAAKEDYEKLVAAKVKKGYTEKKCSGHRGGGDEDVRVQRGDLQQVLERRAVGRLVHG